eukprot:TRINITY_DN2643_c0_g2_i1.p1 TRINITY_DN2643_c0_g2~~TRINITY_DN2643_c0_g2_i1.p1  ORF type:complete len:1057 (+),score=416.62 TRINITY_DN2643_c0_g2_i1:340-3171(+)
MLNWKKHRAGVLATYTTDKDIAVQSKIMQGDDDGPQKKESQTDLAKQRLEQLDGEGRKKEDGMSYFSQKDLLSHLERLATDLEAAWERGEKVKTLRIVIQACKLLSVIKVPQCYPSMFVLTARVLDTFGDLVYARLYEKAVESLGVKKLSRDFRPEDLSLDTKEMCKNWFYKVASIRELVPRILVEMALWRCNRFIKKDPDFFSRTFERFARQVRGIGDPLLSFHARWYVSHKAHEINQEFQESLRAGEDSLRVPVSCEHARLALGDFYFCLPNLSVATTEGSDEQRLAHYLRQSGMTFDEYIALFAPVSRWLIEVIASENQNMETLEALSEQCDKNGAYTVVVMHLIRAFEPELVRNKLDVFLNIILSPPDKTVIQTDILATLGEAMSLAPPESKSARLQLLRTALDLLIDAAHAQPSAEESREKDADSEKEKEKEKEKKPRVAAMDFTPASFFNCARAWVGYAVGCLDGKEVSKFLQRVYETVKATKLHESCPEGLENLVYLLVDGYSIDTKGMQKLFGLQSFLALVDLLDPERKRTACYRLASIYVEGMKASVAGEEPVFTSNTIIVNGLLDLFRSIHDSVTPLTPQDELDVFSYLLLSFICTVDFAAPPTSDFEAQLNFLTECRKSFPRSQPIIVYIITLVAGLIDRIAAANPIKSHSKKSGLFVKVCLVFSHTTICAVTDTATRASLLLATGFMAMHHGFLSHGDQLLGAFAEELQNVESQDLQRITEPLFAHIHNSVAPDNTGLSIVNQVLSILREEVSTGVVVDATERYQSNRGRVYCRCLDAVVRLYRANESAGVFLLDDAQNPSSDLHPSQFYTLAASLVSSVESEITSLQGELKKSATPPNMHTTIKLSILVLSYRLFAALVTTAELTEAMKGHLTRLWDQFTSYAGPMLRETALSGDQELEAIGEEARDNYDALLESRDESVREFVQTLTKL